MNALGSPQSLVSHFRGYAYKQGTNSKCAVVVWGLVVLHTLFEVTPLVLLRTSLPVYRCLVVNHDLYWKQYKLFQDSRLFGVSLQYLFSGVFTVRRH